MRKSSRHHSTNAKVSSNKRSESPVQSKLARAQAEVQRLTRLQANTSANHKHKMFDPLAGP
jgi:hypothetical protein